MRRLSLKAMKALTVKQLEFRDGIKHDDVDALVAGGDEEPGRAGRHEGAAREAHRQVPGPLSPWRSGFASTSPGVRSTAEEIARLPGQLGIYQIADAKGAIVFIGQAGARSTFGLRSDCSAS